MSSLESAEIFIDNFGHALRHEIYEGSHGRHTRASRRKDQMGDPDGSNAQIAKHWLEASERHGMPVRTDGFRLDSWSEVISRTWAVAEFNASGVTISLANLRAAGQMKSSSCS
jgi:hypothetical protein